MRNMRALHVFLVSLKSTGAPQDKEKLIHEIDIDLLNKLYYWPVLGVVAVKKMIALLVYIFPIEYLNLAKSSSGWEKCDK